MREWQTIETAPKDGRKVLLALCEPYSDVVLARWYAPWNNWQAGDAQPDPYEEITGIGSSVPTHWMECPPLPAPPTE